jgi:hypothetical protein
MGKCKEIIIKVIPANIANDFVKKHHYSGKVVPNSVLHFGAFLDGKLHGVLSYGASLNKKGTIKLVEGTGWNEFLELNRMAFDDYLPRNSESYCIGATLRMIKKQAPHIKWVISFADGCSCGDGAIYRASNFILTDIKENTELKINPETGEKIHTITAYHQGYKGFRKWEALKGYQLRYIYFIDKTYRKRLSVPEIPFTKIDEVGAGMYKGEKITQAERHIDK